MARNTVLLLPLLLSVQCNGTGTETENPAAPLISFHGSDCKKMPAAEATVASPDGGALKHEVGKALSFDSSYDGLQCIAWQKLEPGVFRFDLGNFHESCGVDWQKGSVNIAKDGTITLHAINSGCQVARCGWCIYDWSFDVRGVPENSDAHLAIGVVDDDGNRCQSGVMPYDVTIPTHDADQGIVCRPAFRSAVDWQVRARGTNGQLNMPCGSPDQTACTADLSCGPLASQDDLRCLARCSTDSDCPLPGVLACQEGTCRLTRTW